MIVPRITEKGFMNLLAMLTGHKIDSGTRIDELLTELKVLLTSRKLALMVEYLQVQRNFLDCVQLLIKFARVTEINAVKTLDLDALFTFGGNGQILCIDIDRATTAQVTKLLPICKMQRIPRLIVQSWLIDDGNGSTRERLQHFYKLLQNEDIVIKVHSVKTTDQSLSNATALMDLVTKAGLMSLEMQEGLFEFQYSVDGKLAGICAPKLNAWNMNGFCNVFDGVPEVTVEEIVFEEEQDITLDTLKEVQAHPHWKVECVKIHASFIDASDKVMEMVRIGLDHIKTSDMDLRFLCGTDKKSKINIVEVYDGFVNAKSQLVELINFVKPRNVKLFDCEIELTYYENGMTQMDVTQTNRTDADICSDICEVAKVVGAGILIFGDRDLTERICNYKDTATNYNIGYEYFTEYMPISYHGNDVAYAAKDQAPGISLSQSDNSAVYASAKIRPAPQSTRTRSIPLPRVPYEEEIYIVGTLERTRFNVDRSTSLDTLSVYLDLDKSTPQLPPRNPSMRPDMEGYEEVDANDYTL